MNKMMKIMTVSLSTVLAMSQCCLVPADTEEMKNTEIVYVFQNAKGEVSKVIASDWLSNPDGEDSYHQEECEEALPVNMTISYKLDGEEIEPEELAGKSGHVQIRYDFEDSQETEIETENGKEILHVPFSTVTAMLLDNDTFTNVEMTNGKIINDGDRTVALGIAFTGMQEELKLDMEYAEEIEIPDFVELEADVDDFSMEMSVTYVSNSLAGEILGIAVSGDDEAENPLQELSGKIVALLDGVSSVKDGAYSINEGMISVNAGISDLSSGLDTISANSTNLTDGAAQVFQSLLDTAYGQLTEAGMEIPALTIENYEQIIDGLLEQMNPETLQEQATAQVTEAVTAEVRAQVAEKVIYSALNMSKDDYEAACVAGMVTAEQQEMVEQAITDTMENDENVKAQLAAVVSEQLENEEVQSQLADAAAGYEKISGLKTSLDSYQKFYSGILEYTGGVDSAAAGASELLTGSEQLLQGTSDLAAGTETLQDGVSQMSGIPTTISSIENLLNAAQGYKNYSGTNSDVDGEVHFIYRTEEIG